MGRYRELVRALVHFSNNSNHGPKGGSLMEPVEGIRLVKLEYQILEHIVEFEDENKIMADIAHDLGLMPSNVTKLTHNLLEHGLVEKYHIKGNKKNIVLKPTEKGKRVYNICCTRDVSKGFTAFFRALDHMTDEEIAAFTVAVNKLSGGWGEYSDTLIKINSKSKSE